MWEAFAGMALGGCLSGPCNGAGASTSGRKGIQGGVRVVGGGGQRAEHMKLGRKKNEKSHLFEHAQKHNMLVVLCMRRWFAGVA